jgi:hypothetical protein
MEAISITVIFMLAVAVFLLLVSLIAFKIAGKDSAAALWSFVIAIIIIIFAVIAQVDGWDPDCRAHSEPSPQSAEP